MLLYEELLGFSEATVTLYSCKYRNTREHLDSDYTRAQPKWRPERVHFASSNRVRYVYLCSVHGVFSESKAAHIVTLLRGLWRI